MKLSLLFFGSCFFAISALFGQSYPLETVIQRGHNGAVKAVAVSADGKYAITGSRDRSAKLWDLNTGREIRSFLGHDFTVNGVTISPDGKLIGTCSTDQTAKLWEVTTGKELFTTPKDEKFMKDVAFSPDGKFFICGGNSDSASVYEVATKNLVKKIEVNADQGMGVGVNFSFSPDGKWLAIGEDNRAAGIYTTRNWERVHHLVPKDGHCGGCGTLVDFSPDSRFLLKLSAKSKAEIYDVTTGALIKTIDKEIEDVAACAYSPNGEVLMFANKKEVFVYDLEGALKNTITQDAEINEVVFTLDGKSLILAEDNNMGVVINWSNEQTHQMLTGMLNEQDKGGVTYDSESFRESNIAKFVRLKNKLLVAPDGKSFIKGKSDTKAKMWNIVSGAPMREYAGHESAVLCQDLSPDGKTLITGDAKGKVILWDLATGKKIRLYNAHREPLFEVKFNPDGNSFATASWDGNVCLWDINTDNLIIRMDMETYKNYSVFSLEYTPDGMYIVMGNLNKNLELWEPDSKTIVRQFIGHIDVVSSIAFSSDKKRMLSSSWDGTARIWDISTGMSIKKFSGGRGSLQSAIFSPDEKHIITAGDDRVIRIYDISTAKVIHKLEGHQSEITSLVIAANGKNLISTSLDGVVKIWDLDKYREFYEHIHIGAADWMVKTPEGYFNATPGATKVIHYIQGMETFGVEQFYEKFYRPEFLPKLYKNRAERGSIIGVKDALKNSPPPTCKVAIFPNKAGTRAALHIKVVEDGGGIDEVKLLHNGKRVSLDMLAVKSTLPKGGSMILTDSVGMVGGVNVFSVSAFSKGRIESTPFQVQAFSESMAKDATCHILAIGIDKYKNPALNLSFARSDAESFAKTITENSVGIFKKVVVHGLYDENATTKNILDTLSSLASKINQHDVFIYFYAGHGSMQDEKFYFISSDCSRLYDSGELNKKALEASVLQEKLKKIMALKQIIIMDACQSGGSVEMLAMRGSAEEKAISQLSRSAGIHVLASAGTEQNAKELKDLQHGLFTYVLLQALMGKADGAPNDGKVTVYELKSYLDDQVPMLNQKYSGKPQYPYTFSRGHDFPVIFK